MKINVLDLWTNMLLNVGNREDKMGGRWKMYIHPNSIGHKGALVG